MNLPDEKTGEWLRERAAQVDVPPIDTTRWMQLEHLTASQAAAALEGLVPNVEVQVPGPEALQVAVIGLSGKTVDVDKAEQLLATIDVPPAVGPPSAAEMVTETLRVTYVDAEELVRLITSMFAEEIEAYVASSTTDLQDVQESQEAGGLRPSATVVVRGPEGAVAAVRELHAKVDVPPPQVEITATITDVSVDRDQKVGFEWELPGLIVSEESTAGDGFKFGKFVRAPLSSSGSGGFTASFDAMLSEIDGTVLSRTKLVAVNGKSADFLVGEIVPYEVAVAGDGTVSRSVEFQDIGLGLKFGPNVDANDLITLFISPQVRSFTGYSPAGYPIVATREAQTIVRVRDGDVIAIGGLLRDEEIKTLSGIPLLKDIPFFGELFKKRQKQHRRSEVVVFAEVKLMRPETVPLAARAPEVGEG
jgi:type II secretory pathway component GspD/PulD (secretin)